LSNSSSGGGAVRDRLSSLDSINTAPAANGQRVSVSLVVHNLSVCWRLFKGHDWPLQQPQQAQSAVPVRRNSSTTSTASSASATSAQEARKATLLDGLLENYQDSYVPEHVRGRLNGGSSADKEKAQSSSGRDTSSIVEVGLQNATVRMQAFHQAPSPQVCQCCHLTYHASCEWHATARGCSTSLQKTHCVL
jgi:hypothetical protein